MGLLWNNNLEFIDEKFKITVAIDTVVEETTKTTINGPALIAVAGLI